MIKKIIRIIIFPIKVTTVGLYNLCLILSKGFYFYFYLFFSFLSKITNLKEFKKIELFFKKLQYSPSSILLIIIIFIGYILFMKYGYVNNSNEVIYIDDTKDEEEVEVIQDSQISDDNKMILNLYKKYGSYKVSNIDINELKKINSDTIGWLVVDGTNINYPVLKTNDNSFYLTHDFNKNYSIGGWIFMDYRNSSIMDNKNTVIYGHNLINKTAFGSLSSLFTDKWFNNCNHKIIVYTLDGNYTFEIFSVYYKEPESYYLNTNFSSDNDYLFFLKSLKSRSIYDFNVELNSEDKIITLSTCTDNNKGRKVVHAKLIK